MIWFNGVFLLGLFSCFFIFHSMEIREICQTVRCVERLHSQQKAFIISLINRVIIYIFYEMRLLCVYSSQTITLPSPLPLLPTPLLPTPIPTNQ